MPFNQCVPLDQVDEFINQFVELYLADHPQDNQGFTHVSMVRLEVDAQKISRI